MSSTISRRRPPIPRSPPRPPNGARPTVSTPPCRPRSPTGADFGLSRRAHGLPGAGGAAHGCSAPPGPVAWGPAVVVTAGPSGGPTGYEPYILDTGDRLRVFVYGQPNLSRLYTVDQIGNIAVPLIGSVRARGRTTVDLERSIASSSARVRQGSAGHGRRGAEPPVLHPRRGAPAGPIPLRLRHDGRAGRRHRRRLYRARQPALVPHHPQARRPSSTKSKLLPTTRCARAIPFTSTNGSSSCR